MEASPWLHEEVGRRMAARLPLILRQPSAWADWQPLAGGTAAHGRVRQQYPQAHVHAVESTDARRAQAQRLLQRPWWQRGRWTGGTLNWGVPGAGAVQLVWANMGLHRVTDPLDLIRQWHGWLAVDGFLMFSCLGPDSLLELRALYREAGWPAPHHPFTDMHDWGDALVHAGFAEPVLDMERITLTYADPDRALDELRSLGRNLHPERFAGLRTPRWRQRLLAAMAERARTSPGGVWSLTFEIVYGHAFKPAARATVLPEQRIALDDLQAMLARSKNAPQRGRAGEAGNAR